MLTEDLRIETRLSDSIAPDAREPGAAAARPRAMDPWKRFHNEFKALMEEEDRIVLQRVPRDWFYAYVTYRESGEFGCWVEGITTESLHVRFELLATEAGVALGSPPGTSPLTHWLDSLYFHLRANNSDLIRIDTDTGGFIERLCEASAIFCARLDRRSIEKAVMSYQDEEGLAGQHGLRETHGGGDLDSAQSERPDGGDDVDFISDDGRRAAIGRYTNHWTCSEAALARAAKVDPADLSKWKKGRLPAESDKRARIEKALAKNEKPVPLAKRSREDS